MKWLGGLPLAWLLLAYPAAELRADPITQIVVFGDSLLDTGNVFLGSGETIPPSPPYYNGRFSNGPIYVERLAERLGVPAPTPSLSGGTDYAAGDAETGTGLSPRGVPNMGTQIASYLSGHSLNANQLIVVGGGANDFFNGQTNPAVPVANLAADLTALAQAGGKQFLVPNLGPLGNTPAGLSLGPFGQLALNTLTVGFNSLLDATLNQ